MSAPCVYVASRASNPARPAMWQALRAAGWPINSTWIDEAGAQETNDMGELWCRIVTETAQAQGVVLYVEPQDLPIKGAMVECGVALALGKRVGIFTSISPENRRKLIGSWTAHPLVKFCDSLTEARTWAEGSTPTQFPPLRQQVTLDFPHLGSAGPFPVVAGHVAIPDVTLWDLQQRMKPEAPWPHPGTPTEPLVNVKALAHGTLLKVVKLPGGRQSVRTAPEGPWVADSKMTQLSWSDTAKGDESMLFWANSLGFPLVAAA